MIEEEHDPEHLQALVDLIANDIDDYVEANKVKVTTVLTAMQFVYAIIQRKYPDVPAHKLN